MLSLDVKVASYPHLLLLAAESGRITPTLWNMRKQNGEREVDGTRHPQAKPQLPTWRPLCLWTPRQSELL